MLSSHSFSGEVLRIGIPDCFVEHGAPDILRRKLGLDAVGIVNSIKEKGWL